MYKSYKFRIYPNKEQSELLNKSFGCTRFVYNYYLSSQECSVCGNIDSKYKDLSEREYKCCKCYNKIDRVLNASINIMFEGLKLYMKNEIRI